MRANLLCLFILIGLLPSISDFLSGGVLADTAPKTPSLSEYFEPGHVEESEPMPVKKIIGLVIAGLSSIVILLFVFSFLIGPGERVRAKVSESSDPFLTIVAILLVVLFLAIVQNYYNEILDWLKTVFSSA